MKPLLVALMLLAAGPPAHAAIISERPDHVAVTIYHEGMVRTEDLMAQDFSHSDGLAMISESRIVDLPEGVSDIQFRGVAATMVSQTADLGGLEDVSVERNFDYDLLSPGALLQKSVGETVRLVRTNPRTGTSTEEAATILSGPEGTILKIGDRYEALGCSGLPERLIFDRVPEGLMDRPTLTIRVKARRAGRYALTLRYVATGLSWSADYVARVRPDGMTLDLSGWLTLANFSESGFPAAAVDVIAGHVETTGNDRPIEAGTPFVDKACWSRPMAFTAPPPPPPPTMYAPVASTEVESVAVSASRIEARNFGDYKQYPLPAPTDMAARQTKQIQFLDQATVPFERIYLAGTYQNSWGGDVAPAAIILRLRNSEQQGLGKALPAGGVTTTVAAGDEPFVADQGSLEDTPVGLPLEIPAGQTAEVSAQTREVEDKTIGPKGNQYRRHVVEVILTNQKPEAIQFEWRQFLDEQTKVAEETAAHENRNGALSWRVALAAGERRILRYTLDEPVWEPAN